MGHFDNEFAHTEDHERREVIRLLRQILDVDRSVLVELRSIGRGETVITRELRRESGLLRQIARDLEHLPVTAVITQGTGDTMPVTGTIKGLTPGQADNFFVTPIDVNGNADALPAGSPVPTITADDPAVTVTTAADGLSAAVTAPTTAVAGGSFNLNWAASYTDPQGSTVNITATANVPYLAPPALLPTSGVFSQSAPAA